MKRIWTMVAATAGATCAAAAVTAAVARPELPGPASAVVDGSAMATTPSSSSSSRAVARWEYRVEGIDVRRDGAAAAQRKLNEMGRDGWQLSASLPDGFEIFRRPQPQE